MQLIKYFSDFWYVDPFRRYSRSNSKVVKIALNFVRFYVFYPSKFCWGTPSKISIHAITLAKSHTHW